MSPPGEPPAPAWATILVVDDEVGVRLMLAEALAGLGHRVITAQSAEEALRLTETLAPDLVLTDVHMGAMSGIELIERLKADARYALTPVVALTSSVDLPARVAGLAAGADDFFAKPVDLTELRARVGALLRAKLLVDQLERAEGVITTLALTIEARDPYTGGHCDRLAGYAVAVGAALGVGAAGLRDLRLGGYLHDLGKIAVPDRILLKPGPLDPAERAHMRTHAGLGADLVAGLRTLDGVRPIMRYHHERWDGSGYPDGLRGEAIPLGARVIAVVDVFDALRTARPYKPPLAEADALTVLARETEGGAWDPRVVEAFVDVLRAAR